MPRKIASPFDRHIYESKPTSVEQPGDGKHSLGLNRSDLRYILKDLMKQYREEPNAQKRSRLYKKIMDLNKELKALGRGTNYRGNKAPKEEVPETPNLPVYDPINQG